MRVTNKAETYYCMWCGCSPRSGKVVRVQTDPGNLGDIECCEVCYRRWKERVNRPRMYLVKATKCGATVLKRIQ